LKPTVLGESGVKGGAEAVVAAVLNVALRQAGNPAGTGE
jgi:hypothetical protein